MTMRMLIQLITGLALAASIMPSSVRAENAPFDLLERVCTGDYDSTTASERVLARLQSLCGVWYPEADWPLPKSARQIAKACKPFIGTASDEYVNEHLLDEPLLCWYASLDRDRDDIRDFRMSASGFFSENDPDVDNDGIPNHRDTRILKKTSAPSPNGCTSDPIPAIFDWARVDDNDLYKTSNTKDCSGSDRKLCEVQQRLYWEYDVLAYERGGRFNLKTLYAVEDVLTRVFGSVFDRQSNQCASLSTIKSVTVAPCSELTESPFEPCGTEQSTLGEALAHNASMTLFDFGTRQSSMDLLSLLAHEFAHSWQFAMDADNPATQLGLMTNFWQTPGFDAYLEAKHWEIEYKPDLQIGNEQAGNSPLVYADNDVVTHDEPAYRYRGYSWLQLNKDLEITGLHGSHEQGEHASADRLRDTGVLGGYSLSDPWEWHADSVAAYVLMAMEKHLKAHSTEPLGQQAADRLARLQRNDWGSDFYYRNLHSEMYTALSSELPISQSDLDVLTCRYIVYSGDYLFNTAKLAGEDDSLNPGEIIELSQLLRADWQDRCTPIL